MDSYNLSYTSTTLKVNIMNIRSIYIDTLFLVTEKSLIQTQKNNSEHCLKLKTCRKKTENLGI